MRTVTDVNTVNQLLTYSKQAEAGIHQKAIQMLLGAGNNKKQDSLSISDAARGFSKQSIAALIDKNANISNSELAYYFANYNNSSAILDAINFGENVSCGYNSDFKEYGVISFDLNGSRQVVPNYAVPKMNTSTMSGICAANNSLVLSNKSYYAWTTSSGGKYTWTVNNGRIGWAASESLLAENTNQKGTNYKWEMCKAGNILSDLAQGKSVWGYLYSNEEVLSVCEKVGISPGFFSIDAGAGKHTYLLHNPANSCWFWGAGTKPALSSFEEKTHLKGAMISAVDLLKGIAVGASMKVIEVEGENGGLNTNYEGKAQAAIDVLTKEGYDFAYIHVEAPDEMGHQGSVERKVKAIEYLDSRVIKPVKEGLEAAGEDFRMLVLPDHPTPICMRTHSSDSVPYLLYDSTDLQQHDWKYNEAEGESSGNYVACGHEIIDYLFGRKTC